MHTLVLIIVCHSCAFLLIHFSIYLSCYILHLCSHSCGLMLPHTYLYISPRCLHHLRRCHIPVQRLRWAPALICYIIFFTYFVPSICYLLGTNILPYFRRCHIPVRRLSICYLLAPPHVIQFITSQQDRTSPMAAFYEKKMAGWGTSLLVFTELPKVTESHSATTNMTTQLFSKMKTVNYYAKPCIWGNVQWSQSNKR